MQFQQLLLALHYLLGEAHAHLRRIALQIHLLSYLLWDDDATAYLMLEELQEVHQICVEYYYISLALSV